MINANIVIIAGYLTRTPQLRYTPKGTAVADAGIALNRSFKNAEGETKEETTFLDLECYGKLGEAFSQHFTKGRPVLIEGRLRQVKWTDKATGKERSHVKILVEQWHFVTTKDAEAHRADKPAPAKAPDTAAVAAQVDNANDVPF